MTSRNTRRALEVTLITQGNLACAVCSVERFSNGTSGRVARPAAFVDHEWSAD